MSVDVLNENGKTDKRRRRRENGDAKDPIRVVSSLGEGKLLDRFQSSVTERKEKKKRSEKSEKVRLQMKEKRQREMEKFKAEINALLEDEEPLKQSEKMTTFVPKMRGTVKGKFEAIERKKQEDEKKKADNERKRRNEKDMLERKRIEIELAKKKLQEGIGDASDVAMATQELKMAVINQIVKAENRQDDTKPSKLEFDFERIMKIKEKEIETAEAERRKFSLEQERVQLFCWDERQNGENNELDESRPQRNGKKPGKLNMSFEEIAKKKEEKERKKVEMERKMKMEAERRAFKEINEQKQSDSDEEVEAKITSKRNKPRRLTTNFDEIAKAHAEEQRKRADEESKRRLEEEKQEFRAAKMAAGNDESDEDSSEVGSSEKIIRRPTRLASSRTQFDVFEKERMEDDRRRIQERRKKLLEEELKLFEEAKKNVGADESTEDEEENEYKKKPRARQPRRLDASLTKFDIVTQQKLQEKREKIQRERTKLLEDEKRMFADQKRKMKSKDSSDSDSSVTSSGSGSESEREARDSDKGVKSENSSKKKKLTKRRKKKKEIERTPSKLDRSKLKFDVLERQRMEKERWMIQEKRRKLLEEEKTIFEEAKKHRFDNGDVSGEDDVNEQTNSPSPSKLDYAKTRFDIMAQHKMEEERRRIREERNRLLKEEKKLFEEEKQRLKENEKLDEDKEQVQAEEHKQRKPNRLDKSFTHFDVLAKRKKEEESEKIMRESKMKLEEEKKMFREAKKMMEQDEDTDETCDAQDCGEGRRKPQKLSKQLTDFDTLERKRKEEERQKAYEEKFRVLQEEKKSFAEAKRMQDDDSGDESSEDEEENKRKQSTPNRLSSTLTNFEQVEKQRLEKERMEAQERKIKEMEEELRRFQEERKHLNDSDIEEKSEIPSPQVKQPRPKKLSSSFTKFDEMARLRQEEERRKMRELKERELAEERRMFKESREAEVCSGDENNSDRITEPKLHRPISKLNVRQQMESVLQAQREVEQKKIMETKFCRMTVEQQEMYLAKENNLRMLQEKLAKAQAEYEEDCEIYTSDEYSEEDGSEDQYEYYSSEGENDEIIPRNAALQRDEEHESDVNETSSQSTSPSRDDISTPGSNDSGYTGAPWFTQTLTNITLCEGDPVRFDAEIHADPHPKVIWYFKNRLIRNSPDYQYIIKGTQYSLYMNESFYDDMGEYVCKAENTKGVATSKAILTVIEKDD